MTSHFQILPGRPILACPPEQAATAEILFDHELAVLTEFPDLDDKEGWQALRGRPVFVVGRDRDAMLTRAALMGLDRLAAIDVDDLRTHDFAEQSPDALLAGAKAHARARGTSADLTIVEPIATRPTPLPFTLFGSLEPALRSAAVHASCHPDFAALGFAAVLSGITAGAVTARIDAGHFEPGIIYGALIGAPGSNKTGALRMLEAPIAAVEAMLAQDHQAALAVAELEAVDGDADEKPRGKQDRIPRPIVRLSDYTPEAASHALAKQGRGLFGVIPELSSVLPQLGITPGGYSLGGALAPFWLSAYDGGRRDYARRSAGDDPLSIANFAMPLLVGSQPDVMADLLSNQRRDGLPDRFLTAWPDLRVGDARNTETASVTYEAAQEALSDALVKLRRRVHAIETPEEPRVVVEANDAARELFDAWRRRILARARRLGDQEAGARIKATGSALRLAALGAFLRHVVEGADLLIEHRVMGAAIDLTDALLDHRCKAETFAKEPLPERRARELAREAVTRQCFMTSPTEIRRGWRLPMVRTDADLREALRELEDLRWIITPIPRGRSSALPGEIRFCPTAIRSAQVV